MCGKVSGQKIAMLRNQDKANIDFAKKKKKCFEKVVSFSTDFYEVWFFGISITFSSLRKKIRNPWRNPEIFLSEFRDFVKGCVSFMYLSPSVYLYNDLK